MFSFNIEKIFRVGVVVLGVGSLLSVGFIAVFMNLSFSADIPLGKKGGGKQESQNLSIPFGLAVSTVCIPTPKLADEIRFSLNRSRPDSYFAADSAYILSLKKNGLHRMVTLPARVALKYENGLQFSNNEDAFWMDLTDNGVHQIGVRVWIRGLAAEPEEVESFVVPVEECPFRQVGELVENIPFKVLAEARLLGKDLFLNRYGDGDSFQRIEIGSAGNANLIAVTVGDYLAWIDRKWQKIASPLEGKDLPIARVSFLSDRIVLFDVWGLAEYMRLSVSSTLPIPLKTKGDDFLTAVRARSEKQISCMLEKQCFVLRAGDWVLKEGARWKVLRKPQEKEAYIQGKLMGELFVFDKIDLKGGQKVLQGALFNQERSQIFPIEMSVHSQSKTGIAKEMTVSKKGKGK